MKGSLTIVAFFIAGCLIGWGHLLPSSWAENDRSIYALYLLMFLVGFGIGSDRKLKELLANLRPRFLLIPAATVLGTLVASALVSFLFSKWNMFECMAVGSGFAYYSLSSILITEMKTATLGPQLAAELGTIALMANLFREIITLLFAPLLVKWFGPLSPICAGGATTMDTTLPVIGRYSGKEYVFIAVFHGILIDFSVTFFVSFFCSL
ncbi:lysine exporter LysO family protein [Parabacteroides sp. Marseille-P3160]|uniref:lysine exporter LysO family protein n=1 Tax=Parabacteroides sp. Marseille-P3160 TaxID=1917887 RepID=UPI0009BB211C|nr:lysine exporter LysO family protein [Parabacteroides sp. Marseille-P3160]